MAVLSAIKLPNNVTYTLKDNGALQLTGGKVTGPVTFGDSVSIDDATIGNLVVNGSASFTNGARGVIDKAKAADVTSTVDALVKYEDTEGTFSDSNIYNTSNNLIIGSTSVPGNIQIGAKNDNYGILPNTNNYNQIGSSSLYWYRAYVNNYYGGNSHVTNWDAGKNIGTSSTSSAAATLGSVYFYNTCAAGGTQTKTLLSNGSASSNITITLPSAAGTLALTSQIPDISGKADKSATVSTVAYDSTNKKITKTINGTTSDVVTVATLKTALGSMPASDVYSWAKASTKPTYTASEVGALPSNTTYVSTITTTAGAHTAISSKSGAVSFNVPTKTSHLTNDSGFITNAGVTGVKGNSESSYRTGQVNLTAANIGAVALSGGTMTGNLIVPATRIANTYYGISFGRTTETPVETILYTGIEWVHGRHMPVVHVTGYAYGLNSPVEFKIGFYLYGTDVCKIGWCGVTNMGAWSPDVFLFKYTRNNVNYVAVGFKGSCYFLQLQVDLQDEMGKFANVVTDSSAWSWSFLTTNGTIPTADGGTTCIQVPYKANILNPDSAKSVPWSGVTSKPTTISGYGITDAKIANGVITLGSNTITPLTSHQTVTNKGATLSWGTAVTVATIGSTNINVSLPSNPNTNTTYTFANGTNGFTVTPSGGTAQTVTVTPSITNNITGSGTSGYIAKFNGAHTLTNGPAIGTGTTKFLREDGTWATPTAVWG